MHADILPMYKILLINKTGGNIFPKKLKWQLYYTTSYSSAKILKEIIYYINLKLFVAQNFINTNLGNFALNLAGACGRYSGPASISCR